jgi:type VI protein secretion system component VasK
VSKQDADAVAAEAVPAAPAVPGGVSIANHPRARAWIRRSRARVALCAFWIVLLVALHAGIPGQDAVLRALVGGLGGFLCTWAVGVVLWKQIVMAELHTAHERREARRRELAEAAAEREAQRREAQAAKAAAQV